MSLHWSISCGLVLLCITQALALDCLICKGLGQEHPCAQPANEQGNMPGDFEVETCPEPTDVEKEEGLRAVCMKTITIMDAYAAEGGVSSRYCSNETYADACWWEDGGTIDTQFCACSDRDECNVAMATATSLVTIVGAILFSKWLL